MITCTTKCENNHKITLVENMAKRNCICFPIAVLLITLICSHWTTIQFYLSFCDCEIKFFGACDIPLEMCFQNLTNAILQAPKYIKCQLVSQEKQVCSCLATTIMVVKRTAMRKRLQFLFAMFSTTVIEGQDWQRKS